MNPKYPPSLTAFALVAVAVFASTARAHGPAPAALGALNIGCKGPDILKTNIGLAVRYNDTEFDYICPSMWGGVEAPLAESTDTGELAVVGPEAFYISLDRGCTWTAEALPHGIVLADVSGIVSDGEAIWVSVNGRFRDDGTSYLLRWSPAEGLTVSRVFEVGVGIDSVAVSRGVVWLTATTPVPSVFRFEPHTDTLSSLAPPLTDDVNKLTLRGEVDEVLYLQTTTSARKAVWRLDGDVWAPEVEAESSVHGPVPFCDGVVFVSDKVIVPSPNNPPTCSLEHLADREWTCLGQRGDFVYGCAQLKIWDLVSDAPVFELADVGPPRGQCGGNEQNCRLDWVHFGGEAGLVDFEDLSYPASPRYDYCAETSKTTDSCQAQPKQSRPISGYWSVALIVLAGLSCGGADS